MSAADLSINAEAGPSLSEPSDVQPAQNSSTTVLANRRFPVPPSYYTEFTTERWKRYKRISASNEREGKGKGKVADYTSAVPAVGSQDTGMDVDMITGKARLEGLGGRHTEEFALFQKPRIDWIKTEDSWNAFGRVYQRRPKSLSAQELGIPDFRPQGVELSDKQYMHLLLRSMIHTKLKLLEAYTRSVRPTYVLEQHFGIPHEGEHFVQHMANLAATMLTISNGLRETQARLTLELTLRRQLERRKEQTRLLNEKRQELAVKLKRLQGDGSHSAAVPGKNDSEDNADGMDVS
ncbi:hypothetical protein QFC21_001426 [Naganishia friedmannii]|uniref:Uncharacterized protein n=1 Tax=Naganishia friedmannii TaxID=89922 RepID=A0ACC2W4E8_9TREE|nr:hypothetical protein QFC21_001426 [Naganishia friedmannii]